MHLCGAFDIIPHVAFHGAQTLPFPALTVSSVNWAAVCLTRVA